MDNFSIEEQGNRHEDEQGGADIEYLIFESPLGRVRLDYVSRPVVLDKKTIYSRRIGSESTVEYVYSDSERNYKLEIYRWDEEQDDWQEIDAKKFSLI